MLKIGQGAEAVLYRDADRVIKERLSKGYRISQIDESLRKFRTRREAKVLSRLEEMQFPAPRLQEFCDKRMSITMDFLPGEKLRDVIEIGDDFRQFAKQIGTRIGKLHQNNIVHGDLTTSNMIVEPDTNSINFIDFGLSLFSNKIEDKAVDLFLLDRALESKHYNIYPEVFESVIKSYQASSSEAVDVLKRFEEVRRRGRNKK